MISRAIDSCPECRRGSARRARTVLLGAVLLGSLLAPYAMASEALADLDDAQVGVAELIERMISEGKITRSEAEELLERARADVLGGAADPARLESNGAQGAATTQSADASDPPAGDAAETANGAAAADGTPAPVRVTYVPEFVRDEIKRQVKAELSDEVAATVTRQAQREGWGVPAGLPDWLRRLRISGDIRVREQGQLFENGNARFTYRNVNEINRAGGVTAAGVNGFLETEQDRFRTLARLRVRIDADIGDGWHAGVRVASGNGANPVTRNSAFGDGGRSIDVLVDRAFVGWRSSGGIDVDTRAGRFANPWNSTELVWDGDLTFEGISASSRFAMPWLNNAQGFATLGAFPLREIERSSQDAWLFGGQVGAVVPFGTVNSLLASVAYYRFDNIRGVRNTPSSFLRDGTAPDFVQKGNTLFDIRNDNDSGTALFALASQFELVDVGLVLDFSEGFALVGTPYRVQVVGNYVRNLGFEPTEVARRVGSRVKSRNDGYLIGLRVGHPTVDEFGRWSAFGSWRHLERDAVVDAYTDSDFHAGGTDAEGWSLAVEYGLARRASLTLEYLSADEIDGPPLAIDVVQLDLEAHF